jgi:hypothetical protein
VLRLPQLRRPQIVLVSQLHPIDSSVGVRVACHVAQRPKKRVIKDISNKAKLKNGNLPKAEDVIKNDIEKQTPKLSHDEMKREIERRIQITMHARHRHRRQPVVEDDGAVSSVELITRILDGRSAQPKKVVEPKVLETKETVVIPAVDIAMESARSSPSLDITFEQLDAFEEPVAALFDTKAPSMKRRATLFGIALKELNNANKHQAGDDVGRQVLGDVHLTPIE